MWQRAKDSREASGEGPIVWHNCFCSLSNTGFELTYRDSGNTIHFSFFTTQFFPPSLKVMIPKHNVKIKNNFYFNFREKLCFTEFSKRICWNKSLAASGLFLLFHNQISSINFIDTCWEKGYSSNRQKEEWLLLSAGLTAKFELLLVLTQVKYFILKSAEKA